MNLKKIFLITKSDKHDQHDQMTTFVTTNRSHTKKKLSHFFNWDFIKKPVLRTLTQNSEYNELKKIYFFYYKMLSA